MHDQAADKCAEPCQRIAAEFFPVFNAVMVEILVADGMNTLIDPIEGDKNRDQYGCDGQRIEEGGQKGRHH